MAEPLIVSVAPAQLFETGPVTIFGENFNSLETELYIGGCKVDIQILEDNRIEASVPVVGLTQIYDVKVRTVSDFRLRQPVFSSPFYIPIATVRPPEIRARNVGIIPNDGKPAIPSEPPVQYNGKVFAK